MLLAVFVPKSIFSQTELSTDNERVCDNAEASSVDNCVCGELLPVPDSVLSI